MSCQTNTKKASTAPINIRSNWFQSNVLTNKTSDNFTKSIATVASRLLHKPRLFSKHCDPYFFSSSSPNENKTLSKKGNVGKIDDLREDNSTLFSSSNGVIHVSLRHGVRVDVSVDNAIRLTCSASQIAMSLSNKGDISAVKHPNGFVEQIHNTIKITAKNPHDKSDLKRYANMSVNGITFTSSMIEEVFELDTIGTRRTATPFEKLAGDSTSAVFLRSKYGPTCNEEVSQLIQKASVRKFANGEITTITINEYRIWQRKDGLITVTRMNFPLKMRVSPLNRSFTLSTPYRSRHIYS
ncbi:hypothetical protein Bhyg_08771 [Pseudolycoriella hygida]|uniref:Uncharacterized protein n=1 Tax=Pseudolycoriella hygida TaxID=35572 RepID=A0A9Q0N6I6_9DIPT|nr:hypothetical protein Bhyg_08771 [Pseudolycoriella hygida]